MQNTQRPSGSDAWHAAFLAMLPLITQIARYSFRRLRAEAREEAVQEAIANAAVAYKRLVDRDRGDVALAAPLARFAVRQVRDGRQVGNRLNVRDVLSRYCRQRKGLTVEQLDAWDQEEECWREVLVEDPRSTPAELAAARIDFSAWLESLPERHRKIANTLATGESTRLTADRFGLSPSRISQVRRELQEAWRRFHEPPAAPAAAAVVA